MITRRRQRAGQTTEDADTVVVDWAGFSVHYHFGSHNIATEDLVYLLRDSGVHVDVDLEAAIAAAQVAQRAVGHDLPSALLRAGDRIRD